MFLDTVEPRGGGTLLCREAFFHEVYSEERMTLDDRAHLLGKTCNVGDVTLEVVELTGAPGDAYFMDLRVLHTAAPDAARRPRIMATHRFVRAEFMQELAENFGWE